MLLLNAAKSGREGAGRGFAWHEFRHAVAASLSHRDCDFGRHDPACAGLMPGCVKHMSYGDNH